MEICDSNFSYNNKYTYTRVKMIFSTRLSNLKLEESKKYIVLGGRQHISANWGKCENGK